MSQSYIVLVDYLEDSEYKNARRKFIETAEKISFIIYRIKNLPVYVDVSSSTEHAEMRISNKCDKEYFSKWLDECWMFNRLSEIKEVSNEYVVAVSRKQSMHELLNERPFDGVHENSAWVQWPVKPTRYLQVEQYAMTADGGSDWFGQLVECWKEDTPLTTYVQE